MSVWLPRACRVKQCLNSVKLSTLSIESCSLPGEFSALLDKLGTMLSKRRFEQGHHPIDPCLHKCLEIADPVIQNSYHLAQRIQDRGS